MMEQFTTNNEYLTEIPKDLFDSLVKDIKPVKVYQIEGLIDVGMHPLKNVYCYESAEHIGANESDSQGSYFLSFLFRYKCKYYNYCEQG